MEKVYDYALQDEGVIEKVVDTKDVSVAHAIIEPGGSFPKHLANTNVHIVIVRGVLSAGFDSREEKIYKKGNILGVELGTEMELKNAGKESLEFFAVKAPSPTYKEKPWDIRGFSCLPKCRVL